MNNDPNNNNNYNHNNYSNKNNMGGDKIVSEVISWIVTVVMLSVFFPVGVIMLISRLKKYGVFDSVKKTGDQYKQQAQDFKRQAQDFGREAQDFGREARGYGQRWRASQDGGTREQWERQQEEARRRAEREQSRQDNPQQDEAQRRYEQKQAEAKRRFVEKQQEEARRRAAGAYQSQQQRAGAQQTDWNRQNSGARQSAGVAGKAKQKFGHLSQSAQAAFKRSKNLRAVFAGVGGALFIGALGSAAFSFADRMSAGGGWFMGMFSAIGLALGGGVFMLASLSKRNKERQYLRYLAIIGRDDYIEIERLAEITRQKPREVMKCLQDMIDDYWFGDYAYIDMSLGALILSYEARQSHAKQADPVSEEATVEESRSEYEKIIDEIKDLNDRIDDEAMSSKIDRIEEITASIFRVVEENPEKLPQIKTFLNYYLPTTLKLLDAYSQFEAQTVAGENLSSAKASIEGILDNLVQTFEKQLDALFGADALDVSSEIDVLETMMASDGFIGGSAFQTKPE